MPASAMGAEARDAATASIWAAWRAGEQLEGLPPGQSPATAEDAWAIQRGLDRLAGPRIGWKLAATSAAGQRHIGVKSPLVGAYYEGAVARSGESVAPTKIAIFEAEFAFRIGRAVGGDADREEVVESVAEVLPAIEVPESRLADYESVGGLLLTAEGVAAHRLVLGDAAGRWEASELPGQEVVVYLNGEEAVRGGGADVLGDPIEALIWLARELASHGETLEHDAIVMTGAAAPPVRVRPGDHLRADFGPLGEVEVRLDSPAEPR